jgi:hypothetical protein
VLNKVQYFKDRIKNFLTDILKDVYPSFYLEEAAPEDGDPAGSVEVHELEDVGPTLGHHGYAHQEQKHAETRREFASYRPGTNINILHCI